MLLNTLQHTGWPPRKVSPAKNINGDSTEKSHSVQTPPSPGNPHWHPQSHPSPSSPLRPHAVLLAEITPGAEVPAEPHKVPAA